MPVKSCVDTLCHQRSRDVNETGTFETETETETRSFETKTETETTTLDTETETETTMILKFL